MTAFKRATVQGAACGLTLGIVLLIGACVQRSAETASSGADVVRARSFEVVGAKGRAALSISKDGSPSLGFWDEAGKQRAALALWKEEKRASLVLWGGSGEIMALASSGLVFAEAGGKIRARLELSKEGPMLILSDAAENTGVSIKVSSDAGSVLRLAAGPTRYPGFDFGRPGAVLSASSDGSSLTLADQAGNERAILGHSKLVLSRTGEVRSRPVSSLVLFDKEGKTIWNAP